MTHQALALGLLGLVTDGPVRDTVEIATLGFPVFAGAVTPRVGTNRRIGFTQVPISCAGVPVQPDDIVVGDADGVVVIPRAQVAAVVERAEATVHRDEVFVREIGQGKHLVDLIGFRDLITGSR
jgi:4-hydroxy-4-methyl-2-oxoglutarate aldolase